MEERVLKARSGMAYLILFIVLYLTALGSIIFGAVTLSQSSWGALPLVIGIFWALFGFIPFAGLKIIRPNEALVLTLFGKYTGTLKEDGFWFVHPLSTAVNPASKTRLGQSADVDKSNKGALVEVSDNVQVTSEMPSKKMSLKMMTLNNARQKVNDALGNPVEVGVAVMWRVVDTAMAAFNVDNYKEYLSLQTDSALRHIVKIYPYDVAHNIDTTGDGEPDEGSLRGSSETVAERIRQEIQSKVMNAGIEVLDAKITYLAYATEIASVMLQRQQASAVVDARAMIVDGAVSIVDMALHKLEDQEVVKLDDEQKAMLASNLMVVLCGNRDVQPMVNSGSSK